MERINYTDEQLKKLSTFLEMGEGDTSHLLNGADKATFSMIIKVLLDDLHSNHSQESDAQSKAFDPRTEENKVEERKKNLQGIEKFLRNLLRRRQVDVDTHPEITGIPHLGREAESLPDLRHLSNQIDVGSHPRGAFGFAPNYRGFGLRVSQQVQDEAFVLSPSDSEDLYGGEEEVSVHQNEHKRNQKMAGESNAKRRCF